MTAPEIVARLRTLADQIDRCDLVFDALIEVEGITPEELAKAFPAEAAVEQTSESKRSAGTAPAVEKVTDYVSVALGRVTFTATRIVK